MKVVDGTQLHIEQVADLAVAVRVVADAVELEVDEPQPGCGCLPCELLTLGELDAVGRSLHARVADLAGVGNRIEEIR